jgi:hypothetical protein
VETTPQGRGLGLVFAPPDPRNYAYPFTPESFRAAPPDIDLRHRMQPVGNQGQIGSCTGWAGTAAVESRKLDGQRAPLYLYYRDRQLDNTAPTDDAGATMLSLCKALQQYGVPPEEVWPYDPGRMAATPSSAADQQAGQCKADTYYQIKATGLALLQGIWEALGNEECPLLAIQVYQSFEDTGRDGKVRMPTSGERVLGGHAICCCGWFNDNSAPGGLGYAMIQNSWGTGFADEGYMYLPAAYFTSGIVAEAWVVRYPSITPPPPTPDPEDNVDNEAAIEKLVDIQRQVGLAQSHRCAYGATKPTYQSSMAQIMDHDIGPIYNMAAQAIALLTNPVQDQGQVLSPEQGSWPQ